MSFTPLTIGGTTAVIHLSRGKHCLVDLADWSDLSQHRWCCSAGGYAIRYVSIGNRRCDVVRMHRQLVNAPTGMLVDHINCVRNDNRKRNLRLATPSQNEHNRLPNRSGSSKYKGVCWHKGDHRWQAQIRFGGKTHYLGQFKCEEDAARAYDSAASRRFGAFARLNFQPSPEKAA